MDRTRPKPRELDSPLVPKLLKHAAAVNADFASYQSWTDREIPVVLCEPVAR